MNAREQFDLLTSDAMLVETEEDLMQKLSRSERLRVKYGADPSAPDLHLGHSVPLRKLRRFQELGHQIVFIIGDFTARIGDPSGKSKTRPMLSPEEIEENARTYTQQVDSILDMDRCELVYNSSWLNELGLDGFLELASHYTVARMMERDDFSQRAEQGVSISIREFMYPLIQAYDSVAIEADIEIGGTDQTFNFLLARDIMRAYDMEPQVVMTWDLLVGTDGRQKMSKSLGNYIGISEAPGEMFGKLMSIPDDAMGQYYRLLLDQTPEAEAEFLKAIESGDLHPKNAKADIARRVVSQYHGEKAAEQAAQEFERVFADGQLPSDIDEVKLNSSELNDVGKVWIVQLITAAGFASSNSEARRLIRQGAVRVDDERITDETVDVKLEGGEILQVGKRRTARIAVE